LNFGHTAYALAAILLPESRAHGRHMQKTLFPWPALRAREACVLGRACMLGALVQCGRTAGVGATPWVPGDCAWHRGWVEAVGRVLLATGRVWEGGVPVDACRAGQRGIFPCVCVCVCVCFCCAGSGMCGRLGWFCVRWLFQGCCSCVRLRHWTPAAWRAGGLRKRS